MPCPLPSAPSACTHPPTRFGRRHRIRGPPQVKLSASDKEKAWGGCGQKEGLEIWRIENFHVVPWPAKQYGSFYTGDCYILLRTYKPTPDAKTLR